VSPTTAGGLFLAGWFLLAGGASVGICWAGALLAHAIYLHRKGGDRHG